jgi:hypothetical protein
LPNMGGNMREYLLTWQALVGAVTVTATALLAAIRYAWPHSKEVRRSTAKTLASFHWIGSAEETDSNGKGRSYEVDWSFSSKNGSLVCVSSARSLDDNKRDHYKLRCRVIQDRLFQIDYENEDASQVNFGTEILELDYEGEKFSGKFVGWAANRQTIISGVIRAKRDRPNKGHRIQ